MRTPSRVAEDCGSNAAPTPTPRGRRYFLPSSFVISRTTARLARRPRAEAERSLSSSAASLAAAADTLVVSDYPPTGMAELAWSRQTDGTINADN